MSKYRKAVFILTYKREDEKISYLILKRKLHWIGWEFPKGGVEKGESLVKAVKRELKEETGQKPVNILNFKEKGRYNYDKKTAKERKYYGQEWHLFSVQVSGKQVKLDKKEHSGSKWLGFKEAIKLLTWPDQKKCLKIVNNSLK